ncbi:MAG: sigma-54-dependent Fis family transcriptional regulator [Chitinophagaceae bacterium]|nr:sigma-54-dependent Fis family transcriptional regulator [Chitinophagaceae bacterium]
MKTVLIIDDEEKLRGLLVRIIRSEGFDVLEAGDGKTGLKKLEQNDVDAVLCDVKLPDMSGVALTALVKERCPQVEVILLTAYGNIPDGVQAIKNGAFDYITKGDDNDRIIPLLHRAMEKAQLQKRIAHLENQVGKKYDFGNILGNSPLIINAVELARKVAPNDTTVLLLGETGTGKEVFAQAIHNASRRATKPFVALNCSSFSKELLESELFGYKAGAFTNAARDKRGLIEEADTGTLFLDEVGEMPLDLQSKLLRVLETSEFIKLGDTKTTKVNVRIITATNRSLQADIDEGRFREDLFYRLNVFTITLPALRDRKKDIAPLARFFVTVFAAKSKVKAPEMSAGFLRSLEGHRWKGNIRELKNIIERGVILSNGEELTTEHLPLEFGVQDQQPGILSAFDLASIEKLHIQRVLNHTKHNKAETARLLNIGLATLYRKIDEYGLH